MKEIIDNKTYEFDREKNEIKKQLEYYIKNKHTFRNLEKATKSKN